MNELVSIITPAYNCAHFIAETIRSVQAQTYPYWEMLIVDDCSTDNSFEIIHSFSDVRIKYYKTESPSGGPAVPRNLGIKYATGNYIAFLDSDDLWLPNKLETQMKYMKEHNVDFVYSYYSRFTTLNKIGGVIKSPDYADYNTIKKRNYIPILTILIRKEILNGITFQNKSNEDYIFLLHLLGTGIKAYNTKEVVALYRVLDNSRSSNKLDMCKQHYLLLRNEGFSPFYSLLYTITHCVAAAIKYSK